jgi:transcription-repair coupling factor (superfamily II helicase)
VNLGSAPAALRAWLRRPSGELGLQLSADLHSLLAAAAEAMAAEGRSTLVLTPSPERLWGELRSWLGGGVVAWLFGEVTVSFLDRPPALDEVVLRRLEALGALAEAGREPALVVSSRRAMMRATVDPGAWVGAKVELEPGLEADPVELAGRLVELGYVREALAEAPGQFALRGGILDVFPAAGRTPVRAEFWGRELESLRAYDAQNQRSVMAVPRVTVRPGKEVLVGSVRGGEAARRLRGSLGGLREDVRAQWEEDLERLEAGGAFAGVELYAAYLEPGLPSLLEHLPEGVVVWDLEPERQVAEAEELERETLMLLAAEAREGEVPGGFVPPMVPVDRLRHPGRPRLVVQLPTAPSAPDPARLPFCPGDLVVHVGHGVARFKGVTRLDGAVHAGLYLELEYADQDRLFVPLERAERVQPYLGPGEGPALQRLAGEVPGRGRRRWLAGPIGTVPRPGPRPASHPEPTVPEGEVIA